MVRQRVLRINIERRAEFARQRPDGDAFAKQLVADITKIVHGTGSLRFKIQISTPKVFGAKVRNKKPAGCAHPAGGEKSQFYGWARISARRL
jgi:hypothetical protein